MKVVRAGIGEKLGVEGSYLRVREYCCLKEECKNPQDQVKNTEV